MQYDSERCMYTCQVDCFVLHPFSVVRIGCFQTIYLNVQTHELDGVQCMKPLGRTRCQSISDTYCT